jgi:hypothetical protein
MDLGGELGRCQEVLDLLPQAGYAVEPTAPTRLVRIGPSSVPIETLEIRLAAICPIRIGPSSVPIETLEIRLAPSHLISSEWVRLAPH